MPVTVVRCIRPSLTLLYRQTKLSSFSIRPNICVVDSSILPIEEQEEGFLYQTSFQRWRESDSFLLLPTHPSCQPQEKNVLLWRLFTKILFFLFWNEIFLFTFFLPALKREGYDKVGRFNGLVWLSKCDIFEKKLLHLSVFEPGLQIQWTESLHNTFGSYITLSLKAMSNSMPNKHYKSKSKREWWKTLASILEIWGWGDTMSLVLLIVHWLIWDNVPG